MLRSIFIFQVYYLWFAAAAAVEQAAKHVEYAAGSKALMYGPTLCLY
jgi:hypothetical protein